MQFICFSTSRDHDYSTASWYELVANSDGGDFRSPKASVVVYDFYSQDRGLRSTEAFRASYATIAYKIALNLHHLC